MTTQKCKAVHRKVLVFPYLMGSPSHHESVVDATVNTQAVEDSSGVMILEFTRSDKLVSTVLLSALNGSTDRETDKHMQLTKRFLTKELRSCGP
jgi:hypothetical protein